MRCRIIATHPRPFCSQTPGRLNALTTLLVSSRAVADGALPVTVQSDGYYPAACSLVIVAVSVDLLLWARAVRYHVPYVRVRRSERQRAKEESYGDKPRFLSVVRRAAARATRRPRSFTARRSRRETIGFPCSSPALPMAAASGLLRSTLRLQSRPICADAKAVFRATHAPYPIICLEIVLITLREIRSDGSTRLRRVPPPHASAVAASTRAPLSLRTAALLTDTDCNARPRSCTASWRHFHGDAAGRFHPRWLGLVPRRAAESDTADQMRPCAHSILRTALGLTANPYASPVRRFRLTR